MAASPELDGMTKKGNEPFDRTVAGLRPYARNARRHSPRLRSRRDVFWRKRFGGFDSYEGYVY